MFTKSSQIFSLLLSLALLTAVVNPTFAAPAHQALVCTQDYSVQADDWLSKLAEKFYGDPLAYPVIVDATNAAMESDDTYAVITNPDVIEIGWTLCLPDTAESGAMMMDGAMEKDSMAMDGAMAEKTSFNVRVENISDFEYSASGVFNTPVDASEPGPLLPGSTYEIAFNAVPGDNLSFATMFVQSNDLFLGPGQSGIALFNEDETAVTGDITGQIQIWDAGTEINQELGVGADQALHQARPNTGKIDPDNTVRLAADEFGNLPAVSDLVKVTLDSTGANNFVLRIENITAGPFLTTSDGNTVPTPFAPGVWVVHVQENPLFTEGTTDIGLGLEALAEDGNPALLAEALTSESGLNTPFAPGVWVVHTTTDPIFSAGQVDRGEGLEALAEDGNPATLIEALANNTAILSSGVFNTPIDASEPGPLLPGSAYEFNFDAAPDDYLSLATMFVQSNDLFYGLDGSGIALFNADGTPVTGDITDQFGLWDAGTEVNQVPGLGVDQAPRQTEANTGADENGVVQLVADEFSYPDSSSVIRVIISTQ